jgi:TolA-binding protein
MDFTIAYKMRLIMLSAFVALALSGCNSVKKDATIADLKSTPIDYQYVENVSPARKHAIENYKSYLDMAEFKTHYAEALRRVADLELETSEEGKVLTGDTYEKDSALMLSSIEHYNTYLKTYPGHEKNDLILYQLAKAYSLTGDIDKSKLMLDEVVNKYPVSRYIDEVQFRRGEILFVWREYQQAEQAYANIISRNIKTPLYEKALYKLGWTQFKQSNYIQSIGTYLALLDIKEQENKVTQYGLDDQLGKSEREFITDSLRVISLSLSYQGGYKTIHKVLGGTKPKFYEPLIYKQLGELYVKKERYRDAASTYMEFTKKHPENRRAPEFHMYALSAYKDGGVNEAIVQGKILYVDNYGVGTKFLTNQAIEDRSKIHVQLKAHISELANYFHAQARKTSKFKDYMLAARWYRKYIQSFPKDAGASGMNFLLAESLFDAKSYNEALVEYEKTAYEYPLFKKSSEAGYAALLTYSKLISLAKPENKKNQEQQALYSAIRFSNAFPQDKHAPAVIAKTAEKLLGAKKYVQASEFSQRIIQSKTIKDKSLARTAWIVFAHSQFELKQFAVAENAYGEAISRIPSKQKKDKKLRNGLSEKLAASIYKQGEGFKNKGEHKLAVYQFMRLGKVVPESTIRFSAEYDAATLYVQMKEWSKAVGILTSLQKNYPKKESYKQGIVSKLALSYTQSGQFEKAAKQINILSSMTKNPEERRALIWESAEMYEKANHRKQAVSQYGLYIKKHPRPFPQYVEAHHRIAEFYKTKKSFKTHKKWLKKLIKVENKGAEKRTERSRYLAASASFDLAKPEISSFKAVKLNRPLKKNLSTKKKRMKAAISAYKKVLAYKVAEFTTASTYYMGDIYNHLAESLMDSQRPKGLSADELEQYDILLEEQAYPFEEKSIDIHSSNIKRTEQGIYDEWVKKSMNVLAKMQPVRYDKHEKLEPYVLITH